MLHTHILCEPYNTSTIIFIIWLSNDEVVIYYNGIMMGLLCLFCTFKKNQQHQTFIVIGRWGTVHRFSCNPDGQCNLSPNNALRRFSIYLLTNWIFSTLIVATVLLNAVALMKTQKFEINQSLDSHAGAPYTRPTWVMDTMYIVK